MDKDSEHLSEGRFCHSVIYVTANSSRKYVDYCTRVQSGHRNHRVLVYLSICPLDNESHLFHIGISSSSHSSWSGVRAEKNFIE